MGNEQSTVGEYVIKSVLCDILFDELKAIQCPVLENWPGKRMS